MTLSVIISACGGGGDDDGGGPNHVENPQPAAGGGVHEGAINGELNVFVLDADDAPVEGAQVRVGAADAAAPLTGTTDAAGLIIFTDETLLGAQEITVTKSGLVASSWLGANGAVVTIPMAKAGTPAPPPTASAAGTIAGWDSLPTPPTDHITLGLVLFSFTDDLGDPANNIMQPPPGGNNVPPNACFKIGGLIPMSECDWTLVTRTGAQTHYAIIADLDTQGTQTDTDDVLTVTGFASKSGINLDAGGSSTGEVLTMIAGGTVTMTAAFPAIPAGLSEISAIPLVHLGNELLPMAFPGLTPSAPSAPVAPLAGDLAGGTYELVVQARAGAMQDSPQSLRLERNVAAGGTVTLGELLPLPGSLSATAGAYSFGAVSGATLHTAVIRSGANDVWNVALLDGRTSFTLPTLSPSPLPSGSLELHVSALELPNFNAADFDLDDFTSTIARLSEGFVAFTN